MKTKVILTLCVVFGLAVESRAKAQLVAGSPEDKAFQQIDAERNADSKVALLLEFEKQYPQSKALRDAYQMLMQIYQEKNDQAKIAEFGEKVLKVEAENLNALLTLSRLYALERPPKNIAKALQYAQKAIDVTARLRSQPPQSGFTEQQWKDYLESTDQAAKSMLNYAQTVRP